MKIQKQILYMPLLIILFCSSAYATAQGPEIVFYDNKVYSLYSILPLESFYKNRKDRPQFHIKPDAISTGYYRGYTGMWEIKDEKLYLLGIDGWIPEDTGEWVIADLKVLFGDRCIDKRVAATWFTGSLRLPYGKIIEWHGGYDDIYEWDIVIQIESGNVIGEEIIDNSKNAQSNQASKNRNLVDVQNFSDKDADLILEHGANVNVKAKSKTNYDIIEIKTENGNENSAAYFDGKSGQVIIFVPGAAFNKESWFFLAERLQQLNVASLSLDGKTPYDVLSSIKVLKQKGFKKISLVGGSMGGAAILDALDRKTDPCISKVIVLAPSGGSPIKSDKINKFFIVAKNDSLGIYTDVKKIYEGSSDPKKIVEFEGSEHAQHLFKSSYKEELSRLIIDFITD